MTDPIPHTAPEGYLARAQVEPLSKEEQAHRIWACRALNPACTRKEPCNSCRGRRNRRKGAEKQRAAGKALGVPTRRFASQNAHEENWTHPLFCDEIKAGAQVGPVKNFWDRHSKQVVQNRRVGDVRAVRVTAMPDGWGGNGLVVVTVETWRSVVEPALQDHYGYGEGEL